MLNEKTGTECVTSTFFFEKAKQGVDKVQNWIKVSYSNIDCKDLGTVYYTRSTLVLWSGRF